MRTISQWGIHPDINVFAKASHDVFWRSITNGVAIAFENRSEEFKRAWREASLAVVKAINGAE